MTTRQPLTVSEQVPLASVLKPFPNDLKQTDYMAAAFKACGAEPCRFGRTWDDSTFRQRIKLLILTGHYPKRADLEDYGTRAWADLPYPVQQHYKSIIRVLVKWVADNFPRGVVS